MWQWIKSNIFKPAANFFSGVITSFRNWFSNSPQYQLIPSAISHHDETLAQPRQQTQSEQRPVEVRPSLAAHSETENLRHRDLPDEISRFEFLPRLTIQEFVNWTCTCKHFQSTFFQKLLPIYKAAHYTIVKPSEVEVTKILDALDVESLKIFLQRKVEKVVDQSNPPVTILNYTLLQLAYGAGDDEMCLVLEKYFIKAFGSEEAARAEIRKQLDEKFPKNKEEEERQKARDLEIKNKLAVLLAAVIQTISNEQFNIGKDEKGRLKLSEATLQAFAAFKTGFDALHPTLIEWGPIYRSKSIKETIDAYARAALLQWNYDYNKCAVFEDGVLGRVLEHSPGNDAERFSQGLQPLQQKQKPEAFTRTLKTRNGHHFYTYLRGESVEFSLTGSCVDINYGEGGRLWGRTDGWRDGFVGTYYQTKTERLATLRGEYVSAQSKLPSPQPSPATAFCFII